MAKAQSPSQVTVGAKLDKLRSAYRKNLALYKTEMENVWAEVPQDARQLYALTAIAHRLSGSGKAFGFADVSLAAKECELACQNSSTFTASDLVSALQIPVENLLATLEKHADFDTGIRAETVTDEASPPGAHLPNKILLLDDDADFSAQLCAKLTDVGFHVYHQTEIDRFEESIASFAPDLLLVDMDFYGERVAGAKQVASWQRGDTAPLPIIFISGFDHFDVRLAAARAGGNHFLRKPLNIGKLIALLNAELNLAPSEPYRVLIVDDDEDLLRLYGSVLTTAGYSVWTAMNAEQALMLLEQAEPELILIDVYMPACDGIELGKIIRQHEEFATIPMLFMSAAADTDIKLACARLVNDEFINKPVETWRLLMVVKSRVAKGRMLRTRADALIASETREAQDALTGLPKVSSVRAIIDERIAQAANVPELAILRIDIRDFHTVNNLYGYFFGDEVLQRLAWEFTQCLQEGDVLCRESADQFVLLRTQHADRNSVSQLLRDLREAVESANVAEKHVGLALSVDIGIALSDSATTSANQLLDAADAALFVARKSPVADVCFYGETIVEAMKNRIAKVQAIKSGLEKGEFVVAYQPIVDVKDGVVVGFEALARWRMNDNKLIGPYEFIPLLEQEGLISELTIQVLTQSLAQFAAWQKQFSSLFISLNLSAQDIQKPIFIKVLKSLLSEYRLNPGSVVLEITESQLLSDWQQANIVLRSLRTLGVQLAIDDFGTGYSSLSYLQRINADKLKIDRSFIQHWSNTADARLLSSMIQLGQTMGMSVIAEGVETPSELAFLQTIACDQYQGYFKAMPLLADAVQEQAWFKN